MPNQNFNYYSGFDIWFAHNTTIQRGINSTCKHIIGYSYGRDDAESVYPYLVYDGDNVENIDVKFNTCPLCGIIL